MVIGRRNFECEYLIQSFQHEEVEYLAQEEFLNFVLFGVEVDLADDQGDIDHPGLAYLSEHQPAEPTVQESGSTVPLEVKPEWNAESELRKLGYTVRRGTSPSKRKAALRVAVDTLGLGRVTEHLEWLTRLHGGNSVMARAVACWRHDLDWLRGEYSQ